MTTPHDNRSANPDAFDHRETGSAFGGDAYGTPADLSAFDEDYNEVEAPGYADLPDGKYQVRVEGVRLAQSQNGDPMLKWDFVVLSGEFAGRHLFKNAVITHRSLPFVKGDLQTLGVRLGRFSDLPKHLDDLLDKAVEVTQRTKGEYTNLYLNRCITVPAGAASTDLGDEPAPF